MKSNTLTPRARLRNRNTNRLLEGLETRTLFSANVVGSVTGGILSLKGDSYNDNIVIDQVGLTGTQFRVSSGDGQRPCLFDGLLRDTRAERLSARGVCHGVAQSRPRTHTGWPGAGMRLCKRHRIQHPCDMYEYSVHLHAD